MSSPTTSFPEQSTSCLIFLMTHPASHPGEPKKIHFKAETNHKTNLEFLTINNKLIDLPFYS